MSDPSEKKSKLAGAGWGVLVFLVNLVVLIMLFAAVIGATSTPTVALLLVALLLLVELGLAIIWRSSHNLRSRILFFGLAYTAVSVVLAGLAFGVCLLLLQGFHG